MTTELMEAPATGLNLVAGKYLTFVLGKESYGIAVLKVREIIRATDITEVPQMPGYVKGVINLRGKIIPVVDLRIKFGLANVDTNERTCIVVVQVNTASGTVTQMGLVVDAVEEVVNIGEGEIDETPDFGSKLDTNYILGMAKLKDEVKTLLDIDRVVSAEVIEKMG